MAARPGAGGADLPHSRLAERGVELRQPAIHERTTEGVHKAVAVPAQSRGCGEVHPQVKPAICEEQGLGRKIGDLVDIRLACASDVNPFIASTSSQPMPGGCARNASANPRKGSTPFTSRTR